MIYGLNNTNSTVPFPQPPLGVVIMSAIGSVAAVLLVIIACIASIVKRPSRNNDHSSQPDSSLARQEGSLQESIYDNGTLPVSYVPFAEVQQQRIQPEVSKNHSKKTNNSNKKFTFVL